VNYVNFILKSSIFFMPFEGVTNVILSKKIRKKRKI